jgi:hypothetical protein
MTKTREIEMLDSMIATFGPASYLGPWLADNRLSLEADIRNDVTPDAVLPREARDIAAALIVDAKAEAGRIRAEATAFATETRARAMADLADLKANARRALVRLADAV